jgi:hypothetical protein
MIGREARKLIKSGEQLFSNPRWFKESPVTEDDTVPDSIEIGNCIPINEPI